MPASASQEPTSILGCGFFGSPGACLALQFFVARATVPRADWGQGSKTQVNARKAEEFLPQITRIGADQEARQAPGGPRRKAEDKGGKAVSESVRYRFRSRSRLGGGWKSLQLKCHKKYGQFLRGQATKLLLA